MINAYFIWKCGHEEVREVNDNAITWSIGILSSDKSGGAVFMRTDQNRFINGENLPVFVSYQGEEPWMALVLNGKRLNVMPTKIN